MLIDEVQSVLRQRPFVPLRLFKVAGKPLNIPFERDAWMLDYGVLVFKGRKRPDSCQVKGYEVVGFDRIDRIEPAKKTRKRKAR